MKPSIEEAEIDFFYVARQPIFDQRGKTFGYELLFRGSSETDTADIDDHDYATMNVATSGFIKSQDISNSSKRIFINFTSPLVSSGSPRALPPLITVIELQNDVQDTTQFIEKVKKLQQEGYRVALDNFTTGNDYAGFVDLADIVKVDVLGKDEDEIRLILAELPRKKVLKLAYRVDSKPVYELMKKLGFDLFQGYFFARPENLTGRSIKSFQVTKLKILAAIDEPDIETDTLVNLVASDPAITYRLLRLLNSVAFGFVTKIESVRHSITLLGVDRIKQWLRMAVLSDLLSTDKPQELFVLSLNRAKLLEELVTVGEITRHKAESLFLFGMLSLLDVMLDIEFREVLKKLPLPESFQQGYLNPESEMGRYLELMKGLEVADIRILLDLCKELGIRPQHFADAAVRANKWTDSIVTEML
ncbi:EAL and HDOD domain-containing protein [Desulfopila sp. IMCC35008]|uniref:EAL and HDOD domain-containing protein n=1 Tax=Desulfopila sp. IMCC35008 TaxID=2653858 RepID=UPI0013D7FC13|nr:HDOD domain-containing protein [Desulfopila sp. IMCC35008]